MKKTLQNFVVSTAGFPVLKTIYRLYYYLTLKITVFLLSQIRSVASIYLTGGMAAGEINLGLSDIDLIIFTDEDKAVTEKLLKQLNFFFPLLSANESTVYEISEIEGYLNCGTDLKNIYLANRLNEKNNLSKLLYGKKVKVGNAQTVESRLYSLAHASQLWGILINKLIVCQFESVQLSYLCYKLKKGFGSGERWDGNRPHEKPDNELANKTYLYCRESLTSKCSQHNQAFDEARTDRSSESFELLPAQTLLISEKNQKRLAEFIEYIKDQYKNIHSVLVSPVCYVALEEDRLGVFLVESEPLSLGDLKKLRKKLGDFYSEQTLELYILTPQMALSVQWVGKDWWHPSPLLFPVTDPLTFLHLGMSHACLLGRPLQWSDFEIQNLKDQFFSIAKSVTQMEQHKKLKYLQHKNVARLNAMDFQHIFWQALQLKTFERHNTVFCSSDSLALFIQKNRNINWLTDFQKNLKFDFEQKPTQTEKYYGFAANLLSELYDIQ